MRKIFFTIGVGLGFILGSRVGRRPYEQLEHRIKEMVTKPEVKAKIENAKRVASGGLGTVTDKVTEQLPGQPTKHDQLRSEADLDAEVEGTFPSSDPPSTWAGAAT